MKRKLVPGKARGELMAAARAAKARKVAERAVALVKATAKAEAAAETALRPSLPVPVPAPKPEPVDIQLLQRAILAAKRQSKIIDAKASLIPFTELTMPDKASPDNSDLSRYDTQYFHRVLAAALEEVEAGRLLRLIVTFPPRHGKSELTTVRFPAWCMGRDPYRHMIIATYNQPFAETWGRKVRSVMRTDGYAQIFPEVTFAKGSAASDRLITEEGGEMAFVGRGGSTTGRGADILVIDDLFKDKQEAKSVSTREECWDWFNAVASTRLMSDLGAIIIVMTRWHEDDLVGRLTNPSTDNPYYSEQAAKQWKIFNVPAICEEADIIHAGSPEALAHPDLINKDLMGRAVGEALWPKKFSASYLEMRRLQDPVIFSALYQQHPTPEDGDFFTSDMVKTYKPGEEPQRLRIYAASDHAVKTKQEHDLTCLLIVGVDERDNIWLLDCWWKRAKTDVVVEAMLALMAKWRPLTWWAEDGHISGSIGPFLNKRMREEKIYININESSAAGDKSQKAQPIQGRLSMGMVRFPRAAWWFQGARDEMMKFPNGTHDDFVDALAHIGKGLERMAKGRGKFQPNKGEFAVGTFGWIKKAGRVEKQKRDRATRLGSM